MIKTVFVFFDDLIVNVYFCFVINKKKYNNDENYYFLYAFIVF